MTLEYADQQFKRFFCGGREVSGSWVAPLHLPESPIPSGAGAGSINTPAQPLDPLTLCYIRVETLCSSLSWAVCRLGGWWLGILDLRFFLLTKTFCPAVLQALNVKSRAGVLKSTSSTMRCTALMTVTLILAAACGSASAAASPSESVPCSLQIPPLTTSGMDHLAFASLSPDSGACATAAAPLQGCARRTK